MRYFTLNTLGDVDRSGWAFTDRTPEGIGTRWHRLATGVALESDYPRDADAVRLRLGDDFPSVKLPSFLGNTANLLAVDRVAADILVSFSTGRTERLSFVLLDRDEQVLSREYAFVNPLERIAGLNLDRCTVRRSKKGVIKEVKRAVLDRRKGDQLGDLFRLAEEPNMYVLSERVVAELEAQCTNFTFIEVPLE